MNFIVIYSDTLRRDHLGCYGNDWISTPNLDKLARESLVFDRYYTGSFPTIPNRHDFLTGKYTFTYCDWCPLPREEIVLAQALGEAGYVSYMVVDTPHLIKDGYNYDRGFSGWEWIRGQENDRHMTDPVNVQLPCDPMKVRDVRRVISQYMRNISQRVHEEDYFAPKTMIEAMRWLERNHKHEKFLLYVDTFDPHEPWDPPQHYTDMYDPGYEGENVTYPMYGPCSYLTDAELKHVRALYAGEVTMVDRWVGKLLQKIDDLGLRDDTTIIFTTDHGFYFGDHGLIGKTTLIYQQVAHTPLFIRIPGRKPGRTNAFAQAADMMPTILELAGVDGPGGMHGKSLVPVLNGADRHRDFAVSSWSIIHPKADVEHETLNPYNWAELASKLKPSTITTDEWVLICGAGDVAPELYHLPSDPKQEKNVIDANRRIAEEIHRKYIGFLDEVGTDQAFVDRRRKL